MVKFNFNMKYLGVFFFLFLFLAFKLTNQDSIFIYKKTPQQYRIKCRSATNNNLVTRELRNASYPLIKSLPLNYDKTGKQDYTDNIQSVLDKYKNVIFPNFPLLINSKGLVLTSNSNIIFEKGSRLVMKPNSLQNYEILKLQEVQNVSLFSPNIIGDRYKHIGTLGEWGFGISIKGSQNINIYKAVIKNCWGDGIYLGSYDKLVNTAILIQDCFLDNNRRNGISIISGINVEINNCLLSNTNGTLPMSGIDIEPNNNSEFLENIKISNTVTFNNAQNGILIVPRTLQGKNHKNININIINHLDDKSNSAMGIVFVEGKKDFEKIEGTINVVNSVWKYNNTALVNFWDFDDNEINLNFIRPKIINNDATFLSKKRSELIEKCKKESKFSFIE